MSEPRVFTVRRAILDRDGGGSRAVGVELLGDYVTFDRENLWKWSVKLVDLYECLRALEKEASK